MWGVDRRRLYVGQKAENIDNNPDERERDGTVHRGGSAVVRKKVVKEKSLGPAGVEVRRGGGGFADGDPNGGVIPATSTRYVSCYPVVETSVIGPAHSG